MLTLIIGGLVTYKKIPTVTVNYTVRKEPESARTRTRTSFHNNQTQTKPLKDNAVGTSCSFLSLDLVTSAESLKGLWSSVLTHPYGREP